VIHAEAEVSRELAIAAAEHRRLVDAEGRAHDRGLEVVRHPQPRVDVWSKTIST
jgi:hypothetical protein